MKPAMVNLDDIVSSSNTKDRRSAETESESSSDDLGKHAMMTSKQRPVSPNNGSMRSSNSIHRCYSNKEKRECEYFNEEKNLDEGELPSLKVPIKRSNSTVSGISTISGVSSRRLSPNSRSKHRAFWNQLEHNDDDDTDEGSTDDDQTDRSPPSKIKKNTSRALPKKGNEHLVDEEEEGGFMSAILNICNNCGDSVDKADDSKKRSNKKHIGKENDSSINTGQKRSYRDNCSQVQKLQQKETLRGKLDHRGLHPLSAASTYDEDENTAIEIEYVNPAEEQCDAKSVPSPLANTFLQLDGSGKVSTFMDSRKKDLGASASNGVNKESELGSNVSPVTDKNSFLRAMALKAKEDFHRKKEQIKDDEGKSTHTAHDRAMIKREESVDRQVIERSVSIHVDWDKQEYSGWTSSDKKRYLELLKTNSPDDARKIIATSQDLRSIPAESATNSTNLPLFYSNIDSDLRGDGDVNVARKVIGDASSVQSAKVKKSSYSSMSDTGAEDIKHRGSTWKEGSQPDDSRETKSEHGTSSVNLKVATNLLAHLTKRKDGRWMEFQDETDYSNQEDADKINYADTAIRQVDPAPVLKNDRKQYSTSDDDGMISLDPYHDSSHVSVLTSPVSLTGDAVSVLSGNSRSVYTTETSATGASSWSVRSRRRPKGAAKKRLKEDHNVETKKPSGWVESIQAVAAKNQQDWNPKEGWVNYSEPDKPLHEQDADRIGPLKSPVALRSLEVISELSSHDDAQHKVSNVPFPSEWERERAEMMCDVDYASVSASEATPLHVNNLMIDSALPKTTSSRRLASLKEERKSEKLITNDLDDEYDDKAETLVFDKSTVEVKAHRATVSDTVDLSGEKKLKQIIPPLQKPKEHAAMSGLSRNEVSVLVESNVTQSLYDWIEHSDDKSRGVHEVVKIIEKESTLIVDSSHFSNNRDRTRDGIVDDSTQQNIPIPDSESSTNFVRSRQALFIDSNDDQLRMDVETAPTYENDKVSPSRSFQQSNKGTNGRAHETDHRHEITEETEEDEDDPFTQDFENGFGDDSFDQGKGSKGSFEDGFRVIKNSRKITGFLRDENDTMKLATSDAHRNHHIDYDSRSISSHNSENLSRAQEWRKRLESKGNEFTQLTRSTTEKANGAESRSPSAPKTREHDAIFISAADDASTYKFPEKTSKITEDDSVFDFKGASKELQRAKDRINSTAPVIRKPGVLPLNPRDTALLHIKSVSVEGRPSIPNDLSSISTESRQLSRAPDTNDFGIGNFLTRLQACATPVLDSEGNPASPLNLCALPTAHNSEKAGTNSDGSEEVPLAHLAFLRSSRERSSVSSHQTHSLPDLLVRLPVAFCGRPETIYEEEEERGKAIANLSPDLVKNSGLAKNDTNIQSLNKYPIDESKFLANGASEADGHTTLKHSQNRSEKWQKFMEKRSASVGSFSSRKSSVSDISRAAEKFAAMKVEEIMKDYTKNPSTDDGVLRPQVKSRSAKAAEDLAATRVEAMMAKYSLSGEA